MQLFGQKPNKCKLGWALPSSLQEHNVAPTSAESTAMGGNPVNAAICSMSIAT
jgi:hypothetical protein